MSRSRSPAAGRRGPRADREAGTPCFALTVPGLEGLAASELEREIGAIIKRQAPGLVVFRTPAVDRRMLRLRMVEDVFLLAWGTDRLTYRAADLAKITQWTAREASWPDLFALHHGVRPKPTGKPTYHLVAQMRGEHGYRRVDALKALARGMAGKFPASWKSADEGAGVEVWLMITGAQAICGLRLSDRTMRHRTYKREHVPASLRPVVAAALVHLAGPGPDQLLVDPTCGAGTILAERLAVSRNALVLGGDSDRAALVAAYANLRRWQDEPVLVSWDARRLPLSDGSIPCLVANPPFGKQLGDPEQIAQLYRAFTAEWNRVLIPGGTAVVLVSDIEAFQQAAREVGWHQQERLRVRLLGQPAAILAWRRGG